MLESIADLRSQLAMPGTASVQRPLLAVTIQHLRVQLRYNALVQVNRAAASAAQPLKRRPKAVVERVSPATNCYIHIGADYD